MGSDQITAKITDEDVSVSKDEVEKLTRWTRQLAGAEPALPC